MFKFTKYIYDNNYINTAGLLALALSPAADALGGGKYFWWLFGALAVLFLFGFFDELKKQKKLKKETIHIPIVVKVDNGPDPKYVLHDLIEKIEKQNEIKDYEETLKKYLGINLENLVFEYNGSIYDFDRLMSFHRIIRYQINMIEKQLDGRVQFHLAYYKRPSVGFMLGTIFRTESLVVYQNSDHENRFYPVAKTDSRKYKERIDNFTKYEITENIVNPQNNELLIVIESASHNIAMNAESLAKFENITFVKLIEKGTIPYASDWVEYAAEIYNVINNAQSKYKSITVAHAMPEAIAVVVGMAIENYWNVHITQFDNNEYKYMYTMKQICYF